MVWDPRITRRLFLRLAGSGFSTLYLGGCTSVARRPNTLTSPHSFLAQHGPIDRAIPEDGAREFSGDSPERAHSRFWGDVAKARLPAASPESARVVIVGGGVSGLVTAYLLRDLQPIILEQSSRFGGNSRGESWRGIDYSIGAAYFSVPEEQTELGRLYAELGVRELCRVKDGDDPVELGGELKHGFWAQYPSFIEFLKRIYDGEEDAYPEIPPRGAAQRAVVNDLDRFTLEECLRNNVGAMPEALATAVEYYCWSSLNACANEVSAAAGLNFLASELGATYVAPGGNAAVVERLLTRLVAELPREHFRTDALVTHIEVTKTGARVTYEDGAGRMSVLESPAVVVACPKFVAARVLANVEPERKRAIEKLKYRSYLVANILLEKMIPADFYDLLLLGDGSVNQNLPATDVVHGRFAAKGTSGTVLTLYKPIPVDGARGKLLGKGAYATARGEFERQISDSLLKLPPFRGASVHDLRLTRWGHPIPVPVKGLFADGTVDILRRPHQERVFFVQQDNWMTPSLETAATEAFAWAEPIRAMVEKSRNPSS